MNSKRVGIIILILLALQVVHTNTRLLGKSYTNFTQSETDFVSKVETAFAQNQDLFAPYSMFYMKHKNNPELIKNYFASQYSLVPRLVSDKARDASLPELVLVQSEYDGRLTLSVIIPD